MGVYIKGTEMPKSCSDCFACHVLSDEGLYCEPLDTDIEPCSWGRLDNCPLVPVAPHGDLIDREPFIQFIKTHWDSYDQWVVEQLEARPTIIPAEEGET